MKTKQEWKITFEWPDTIRDGEAENTGGVLSDNIVRAVHAALSRLGDGRAKMTVTSQETDHIIDETVFSLGYQIRRRPAKPANESCFGSVDEAEAAIENYYRLTPPEQAFPLFAYRDRDGVWRHGYEDGRPGIISEYETREEAWDGMQYLYDGVGEETVVVSRVKAKTTRSLVQAS